MKIAFVGKGGTGKSSVSWLIVKALEHQKKKVLAVDADHNMDLTSTLGIDYETVPLMYKTENEFSSAVGRDLNDTWKSIILEDRKHPVSFNLDPKDDYTKKITSQISEFVDLITVGLGDPDVISYGKCAHGLSSPLKYYLGFLDEKDSWVVIDSVAGVDMVNFGLFSGTDAMICVVEPQLNSVKVFKQIKELARKTMSTLYVVVNKPTQNSFYEELYRENKDLILGEIPFDENISLYSFERLHHNTKTAVEKILETILLKTQKRNNLESMKEFQKVKMIK